ncbi:MAG: hypothetical protein AABY30_06310 [Candidatus Thermoplasmatota archaeon]
MVEVSMQAIHAVTVEMHGGMLTLAIVCVLIKMADLTYQRFLPGKVPRLYRYLARASAPAGPAAVLAAIGGVLGLVASAITGYLMSSGSSLTNDPLAMNKVMVTIFAIELWSVFIFLAIRNSRDLWQVRRPLPLLASTAAFLGFVSSVVGGSLGGTMAGKGSILDPLWGLLGVDLHTSWILTMQTAIPIAVALNVAAILLLVRTARRSSAARTFAEESVP